MRELTITIKNLEAIKERFKRDPAEITRRLNSTVGQVLARLEADAKKEAPVNKQSGGGNLRQSIVSYMTGPARGVLEVRARYGAWVHDGTRPHIIRIVNKRILANRRSGQFFGTVVKHPGTKANPFLQRAIDKNQSWIDKRFEAVLDLK
jgi:HK97 gp10 family phage protein